MTEIVWFLVLACILIGSDLASTEAKIGFRRVKKILQNSVFCGLLTGPMYCEKLMKEINKMQSGGQKGKYSCPFTDGQSQTPVGREFLASPYHFSYKFTTPTGDRNVFLLP